MNQEIFTYRSFNNKVDIVAYCYKPASEPIGILQISHGMVEYIERYEDFASFLTEKGYLVVGNDHIGHGASVNSKNDWGYFDEEDGNKEIEEDLIALTRMMKKKYPNLPYFLLGHSMGSFYARQYMEDYGNELKGAIIMGTAEMNPFVVKMAMLLCKIIALLKGWHYRSSFINELACGSYNKQFEPTRTRADWLSKDSTIVDLYVKEPRNSFVFTLNGFYAMFQGILRMSKKERIALIPKDLPILFVSGENDPVGENGKAVIKAYEAIQKAGCKNVSLKLYPNDRHEILNELDKQDVYKDLWNWLEINRKKEK